MAGAADGEVLDPGQGASGGLEVQHHLLDWPAEAAVQPDPVLEHAFGHQRIRPCLKLEVQDLLAGSARVSGQQDHRIGVEGIAAEFAVQQLPCLVGVDGPRGARLSWWRATSCLQKSSITAHHNKSTDGELGYAPSISAFH